MRGICGWDGPSPCAGACDEDSDDCGAASVGGGGPTVLCGEICDVGVTPDRTDAVDGGREAVVPEFLDEGECNCPGTVGETRGLLSYVGIIKGSCELGGRGACEEGNGSIAGGCDTGGIAGKDGMVDVVDILKPRAEAAASAIAW